MDFDETLIELDNIIEENPTAENYLKRAQLVFDFLQGNNIDSKEDYIEFCSQISEDIKHAIKLNPNYAEAYYLRGLVCMERGDNNEAASNFEHAISIDDSLNKAHSELNRIHWLSKGIDYSEEEDSESLENEYMDNKDDISFEIYGDEDGKMYLELGKDEKLILLDLEYKQAETKWYKVQGKDGMPTDILLHICENSKDSNKPIVLYLMGGIRNVNHLDKMYIEKALTEWNTSSNASPDLVEALYTRGSMYKIMGDYDHAMRDFLQIKAMKSVNLSKRQLVNKEIKEIEKEIGVNSSFWSKVKRIFN